MENLKFYLLYILYIYKVKVRKRYIEHMTLSLSTLPYYYKNNTDIQYWLENSYKVNGFNDASEDILTLYAQLKSNSGFNPFDSLDTYSSSLESGPMGDYINAGIKAGSLNPYYKQADNDYYSYTNVMGYTGVEIVDELIDPLVGTLDSKVTAFMATANFASIAGNQVELTKLYKQLSGELEGLKEYTLTNNEIQDVINEINTLNGAGVLENIKDKIDAAQDELLLVFKNQLSKIVSLDNRSDAIAFLFKGEGSGDDGGEVYSANNTSNATLNTKLFGNAAGTDYENNPFFEYFVALRTNPDLTFLQFLNQELPEFDKSNTKIKDAGNFKMSNYTGIEDGDEQLSPLDILDGLYITQELKALYSQYEEALSQARSMELSLTLAIQNSAEFDFRKVLAEKILAMLDTEHQLEVSNESDVAKNIQRGSIFGPSSLNKGVTTHGAFDGFYGDVNTKATPTTGGDYLVDPYEIVINGNTYIMGRDANSNGNIDDVSEILGITDSQDNPFQSLIQLDTNKDGKVSQDELVRNGIVLKAVDASGKLTENSFDISLINNIDLKKLNSLKDGNSVGTFEMTFLNGRTLQGSQTFENQAYFNTLFDKLVDLSAYKPSSTTSSTTSKTTSTEDSTTSKTETASTTTSAEDSVSNLTRDILLKQINDMYSALVVDDTSNIETILDNVCWKSSTILTPAQRIKIIDGIDPLMPVYQVEAKINAALKTLNA